MVSGKWRDYNALLPLGFLFKIMSISLKKYLFTVCAWKLTGQSQFCLYTLSVLGNGLTSPHPWQQMLALTEHFPGLNDML